MTEGRVPWGKVSQLLGLAGDSVFGFLGSVY